MNEATNELAFGAGKWMAYAIFLWLAYMFLKSRLSGYALILAATAVALTVGVLLTGVAFRDGGQFAFAEALRGYSRPAFVIAFVMAGLHFLNTRKSTQ